MDHSRPFFSIITPVYKGLLFIKACCGSVAAQTCMDYEHILVEDGSPDESGALCDELAGEDTHIRVFHTQNGGVTSARNHGIHHARGRYLLFLDQDDRLSPYALEAAISALALSEDDLVSWRFHDVWEEMASGPASKTFYYAQSQLGQLYCTGSFHYVWTKIFDTAFLRENGLRFDEQIQDGTDDLPFVNAYLRAWFSKHPLGGVRFLDAPYYYYETHNASSVSNRLQPYQPSHLTMFAELLYDMTQLYGCPAPELGLVYYICLHTLAYGIYSTPPAQRKILKQRLLCHPELLTILKATKHCRIYSPFYLAFRLKNLSLICFIMGSYQGNKLWYWRLYHLGYLLLGGRWNKI